MSELIEEKITMLENGMGHMEDMLADISKRINKIEVGIFGDVDMYYPGLLGRVKKLEDELSLVKKVNDEQEISISAKNNFKDEITFWARRAAWVIASLIGFMYLITGKVGIVDIIKMFR